MLNRLLADRIVLTAVIIVLISFFLIAYTKHNKSLTLSLQSYSSKILFPGVAAYNYLADSFAGYSIYLAKQEKLSSDLSRSEDALRGLKQKNAMLKSALRGQIGQKAARRQARANRLRTISTRVIAYPAQNSDRMTVLIDQGAADGVSLNQAVVAGGNHVAGQVVSVSKHSAVVMTIFDPLFTSSAESKFARTRGVVKGDNRTNLLLDFVPKNDQIMSGEIIYTSKSSSVFPAGLQFGTVSLVSLDPNSLFKTIEIAPAIKFANLDHLSVVRAAPGSSAIPERDQ